MTIHLIKLSVGPESLSDLADWQKQRLKQMKAKKQKPELMHVTRSMPRRAEELLEGGSIYWVIKGWICARQKLLELRPVVRDGIPHCGIIYDKELVRVRTAAAARVSGLAVSGRQRHSGRSAQRKNPPGHAGENAPRTHRAGVDLISRHAQRYGFGDFDAVHAGRQDAARITGAFAGRK